MADDLIKQYRQMAAKGDALRGLAILRYRDEIASLVRKHGAKKLLDYGSGAGDQWRQPHRLHRDFGMKWFDVKLYDPAFEHCEKPHGRFDGVLCSDVLEHVPEDEVEAFVATLFSHAKAFVWASVCTRPAKKAFDDGTNLHCTVKPIEWWRAVFEEQCEGCAWTLQESP